ncbi:MAG: arylsulfatase [Kiritimatiellae bacterium]|nr:arylsulfatase [Kiritimatiellia bacterium]
MSDTEATHPNVIFVITDDQGYGDLGCHGNPILATPNLDALHADSVRLVQYHVGPTCAPTRAGLMTGRYCNCTGVWHTIAGWSLLRKDETTLGDVFRAGGYRTGMFGKWHLGDNYPFRPHDRGFDDALYHCGGGVSQTPDHWGNDYFDDTYKRNGVPEPFEGYCTDVWFREAARWIEANRDRPFFCYLSTNAPHGPYNVAPAYSEPYRGRVPEERARFYGMITNIDENVGRLRARLRELGLDRNTLFIFMTDNGTSGGCTLDKQGHVVEGYNAGMRGVKGSPYDGGHRTPLFLHWPAGGLTGGRDVTRLTANVDMLSTLAELCGIPGPDPNRVHGKSIVPLLRGDEAGWPDRVIVTDSQRVATPVKWRQSATMTDRWRLVNGKQLYDIQQDPGQREDVADRHPDVLARLRAHYETWWARVSVDFANEPAIIIGTAHEPVTCITNHDWHNEACNCAWNQGQVREGLLCNGRWRIDVAGSGEYTFELRRWPREEDRGMTDGIPGEIKDWYTGGRAIPLKHARIRVGDQEQEAAIGAGDKSVAFTFTLEQGETDLQTWLTDGDGHELGAYYVYVRK